MLSITQQQVHKADFKVFKNGIPKRNDTHILNLVVRFHVVAKYYYATHRTLIVAGTVTPPLRWTVTSRCSQDTSTFIGTKPCRFGLFRQLAVRFSFVLAKQTCEVPITRRAITKKRPFFQRVLSTTRAILTTMTIEASSKEGCHVSEFTLIDNCNNLSPSLFRAFFPAF
jgi:hypothetical protein